MKLNESYVERYNKDRFKSTISPYTNRTNTG